VIDLARLLSGFCPDLIDNGIFFDALFRAAEHSIYTSASSSSKAKETNALLVLRTVANTLQEGTDISWVEKVGCHAALRVIVRSRKGCMSHTARFLEFSIAHRMRNSPRGSASLCLAYFLSKPHPSSLARLSSPRVVWLELIGFVSFSCLTLQEGVGVGLRAQHIRLISDVWFLLGCRRRRRDADRNVCIYRFCV
jgi:hypothetical protein